MLPLLLMLLVSGQSAPPTDSTPAVVRIEQPQSVLAWDTPNDKGKSINLKWQSAGTTPVEGWLVERTGPDGKPEIVATTPADEMSYVDEGVLDGKPFAYRVAA